MSPETEEGLKLCADLKRAVIEDQDRARRKFDCLEEKYSDLKEKNNRLNELLDESEGANINAQEGIILLREEVVERDELVNALKKRVIEVGEEKTRSDKLITEEKKYNLQLQKLLRAQREEIGRLKKFIDIPADGKYKH